MGDQGEMDTSQSDSRSKKEIQLNLEISTSGTAIRTTYSISWSLQAIIIDKRKQPLTLSFVLAPINMTKLTKQIFL